MPKLRVLSGKEIISFLESKGFVVIEQHGSHVKLRRESNFSKQTLLIPNHREILRGTMKAIYNQTKEYLDENEIRDFFYS